MLSAWAGANDRPFMRSGSWVPMNGEHQDIRMVSEDVHIRAYFRNYDVVANFEFSNQGPEQTVRMGFPEWGHDFPRDKSAFTHFRTSVDGVNVPVQRIVKSDDPFEYRAWWVKTVSFHPHQVRHVTVRFTAPLRSTPDGDTFHALFYDFTGKDWKGKVAESRLDIRLPFYGADLNAGRARGWTGFGTKTPGLTFDGRTVTYRRRNWEAEERFQLVYKDPANMPPLLYEIKEADLKGKTARQLTILRNQVLARHGRKFSDPALRRHFESQSWYSVDPDYSDQVLNRWEKQSIQTIQQYQNQHGLNW